MVSLRTTRINIQKFFIVLALRWVFLRTQNRQRLLLYKSLLIGFYNRDGECLLRGSDRFPIKSRLRLVLKRLISLLWFTWNKYSPLIYINLLAMWRDLSVKWLRTERNICLLLSVKCLPAERTICLLLSVQWLPAERTICLSLPVRTETVVFPSTCRLAPGFIQTCIKYVAITGHSLPDGKSAGE
jgi:hypothetical protein